MLSTNISFANVKHLTAMFTTIDGSAWMTLIIGDTELTFFGNGENHAYLRRLAEHINSAKAVPTSK